MRIGIIGPIGSGKSTLAHLLSTYYNVPLVKEPVESSPFLPLFYKDKYAWKNWISLLAIKTMNLLY